jgi:hypothetical protein
MNITKVDFVTHPDMAGSVYLQGDYLCAEPKHSLSAVNDHYIVCILITEQWW